MCGIVGLYYLDSQREVRQDELKLMADRIVHRGPDDEGFFVHKHVGLGMRRLSIIDVSGGHQPIYTPDRDKVIVFNGEVYNFGDHRPDLENKGHRFGTHTDTEVVLHLYDEYGLDFLEKLNGMFGLAIWDDREKELIVARDRLGIKQVYYYQDGEKIIFASEIKSILALFDTKPEINLSGLAAFLKYGFTPAPYTLFDRIRKIPPGHYLRLRDRKIDLKSYWTLSYVPKNENSPTQIKHDLYELIKSSVKYRMISDVPLGAFLSGGIDSSSIVHLMSELGTGSTSTYSIGFGKGYEFYNELDPARRFANEYNTNHHEILVEPDVKELFPKLVASLDEPLADSSFIVTFLVSKLARESVTVILSGVGGDELFGGYRRYLNASLQKYVKWMPAPLRKHFLSRILNCLPVDRNNTLLNYFRLAKAYMNSVDLAPEDQYSTYTSVFDDEVSHQMMIENKDIPNFFEQYFQECDSSDVLDKIMYFDLKMSLPDQLLMLSDKMSMATSLELRVPYLDHRVVEFAAKIPSNLKINGLKLRHIQKEIFKGKFPDFVFKQKKKGFGAPIGSWIRNELKPMAYDLFDKGYVRNQGIFDHGAIHRILNDHFRMKEDYTDNILALLTFQIWYEEYLNQPAVCNTLN